MTQVALQVAAGGAINKENDVRVVSSLTPQAIAATTTTETTGVDLQGYEAASVIVHAGVCTDGEYDVTILHSDDDGVGDAYTAVDCLDSAFTTITSSVDDFVEIRRVREIDAAGDPITLKRWIKALVTESSAGSTGVIMSVEVVLGGKRSSDGGNLA